MLLINSKGKSLDGFIEKERFYGSSKQIDIGFDPIAQKEESVQYVPLLTTLETTLEYEDASSLLYSEANNAGSNDSGMLKSCRNGTAYKENIQTQM